MYAYVCTCDTKQIASPHGLISYGLRLEWDTWCTRTFDRLSLRCLDAWEEVVKASPVIRLEGFAIEIEYVSPQDIGDEMVGLHIFPFGEHLKQLEVVCLGSGALLIAMH